MSFAAYLCDLEGSSNYFASASLSVKWEPQDLPHKVVQEEAYGKTLSTVPGLSVALLIFKLSINFPVDRCKPGVLHLCNTRHLKFLTKSLCERERMS